MGRTSDTPDPSPGENGERPAAERQTTGRFGESVAAAYLQIKGFRILARNYRDGPRELDLVARFRDYLVIVEVRTRHRSAYGSASESVNARKRRHLLRAGKACWSEFGDGALELRFDLVAVSMDRRGLRLDHYSHFLHP